MAKKANWTPSTGPGRLLRWNMATLSENCGTQGRANISKIKALILIKCDP